MSLSTEATMPDNSERVMATDSILISPFNLWNSEKQRKEMEMTMEMKLKNPSDIILKITRFSGIPYIYKCNIITGVSCKWTVDRENGDYHNVWLHCDDGTTINFSDIDSGTIIEFIPLSVFLEKIKSLVPQPGVCKHKFISMEKTIFCEHCGRSAL